MTPPPVTPLCIADPDTFWPWRRWPEFSRWQSLHDTTIIVPVAGMADWGLGHALDAEETVLMSVLREATQSASPTPQVLVTPPLRFVLGPAAGTAFTVTPPVAHNFLAEVTASIVASGFRRLVFYNSSPWNEELTAAAARDLRIAHGVQIYRISLSGLGLDFHPTRSPDRQRVQTLLTGLTGRAPEAPPATATPTSTPGWGDQSLTITPLTTPPLDVTAAAAVAPGILTEAATLLQSLLDEIATRPFLPHDGKILPAQPA
jgi:creatinine amidohydrolase